MKPCPFCGSENQTIGYNGQPAIEYYVLCLDCRAQGGLVSAPMIHVDGNEIIKMWDRRKGGEERK